MICGYIIIRSELSDSLLCHDCEEMTLEQESMYTHLDNA